MQSVNGFPQKYFYYSIKLRLYIKDLSEVLKLENVWIVQETNKES